MDKGSKPTRAAKPRYQAFDPWVPVAGGHQVADGSHEASSEVNWRAARAKKLAGQFSGGRGGGSREYDTILQGAQHYDKKLGGIVTPEVRSRAITNVKDMLTYPGLMKEDTVPQTRLDVLAGKHPIATTTTTTTTTTITSKYKEEEEDDDDDAPTKEESRSFSSTISDGGVSAEDMLSITRAREDAEVEKSKMEKQEAKKAGRKIFDGVNVYVNGSTFPTISDHKLKHLMAEHGGAVSLHLGRRCVTHVVVGRPVGRAGAGAGGGLAGGKLEKEIRKTAGIGIKFVGVEWILESVKAGKRLPEARFVTLKIARQGQSSVYSHFTKAGGSSSTSGSR